MSGNYDDKRDWCGRCPRRNDDGCRSLPCPVCLPGPDSTDYAYIYSTREQIVPVEGDVAFNSNGLIVGGIAHTPADSEILLTTPGSYEVTFFVSGSEANQFTLCQDGVPVDGAVYGSGDGNQQSTGQAMILIAAPTILTLRNHTSTSEILLQCFAGGSAANTTASVTVKRMGAVNTAAVGTVDELLAALTNQRISIINIEPSIKPYDISASPSAERASAVLLQSQGFGATILFSPMQSFLFITLGDSIAVGINNVLNETQELYCQDIPTAVAQANPGDSILIFPGTYSLLVKLVIDKPLTLRGFSEGNTLIQFDPSILTGLEILSDDVTIAHLHFVITTTASGTPENRLIDMPSASPPSAAPVQLYSNLNLCCNIFEGGWRIGFIYALNMNMLGNTFIHTGGSNSLELACLQGVSTIAGNDFIGSEASLASMALEPATSQLITTGTINILNNKSTGCSRFMVMNVAQSADVLCRVSGNNINHGTRSGSAIVFRSANDDFTAFYDILIDQNTITNISPNRLAVSVDFCGLAGGIPPAVNQIRVYDNYFDVAAPWGEIASEVSAMAPVGYSKPAPPAMTILAFDLQGNTVIL